jgi:P pilus assembly chaperone PapD
MIKNIVCIITLSLCSSLVFAGISVNPARYELFVTSGVAEGKYTITSDFDCPARVNVEFKDWFVLPENSNLPARDWLSFSPSEFLLKPGESKEVSFKVNVSTTAQGSLVAMVSFVPQTETEQGVTLVMSSALYVVVRGTEKVAWEISSVSLTGTPDKFQFTIGVKNSGNIHIRPNGTIYIRKGNKVIGNFPIPEGRPVYPGSTRASVARSEGNVVLAPGKYTVLVSVNGYNTTKVKECELRVNKDGTLEIK